MDELQFGGEFTESAMPLSRGQSQGCAHRGERLAWTLRPAHKIDPTPGTLKREPVPGRLGGEIPGNEIGPGHEEKQGAEDRGHQPIHHHPEAMVIAIATEGGVDNRPRAASIHIVRKHEGRRILMP